LAPRGRLSRATSQPLAGGAGAGRMWRRLAVLLHGPALARPPAGASRGDLAAEIAGLRAEPPEYLRSVREQDGAVIARIALPGCANALAVRVEVPPDWGSSAAPSVSAEADGRHVLVAAGNGSLLLPEHTLAPGWASAPAADRGLGLALGLARRALLSPPSALGVPPGAFGALWLDKGLRLEEELLRGRPAELQRRALDGWHEIGLRSFQGLHRADARELVPLWLRTLLAYRPLHPELLGGGPLRPEWLSPELLRAVAEAEAEGHHPGMRAGAGSTCSDAGPAPGGPVLAMADGLFRLQVLAPPFCRMLAEEVRRFEAWAAADAAQAGAAGEPSVPSPDPLDALGLQWIAQELSDGYLAPLARSLLRDRDVGNPRRASVRHYAPDMEEHPRGFGQAAFGHRDGHAGPRGPIGAHQDSSVFTANIALADAAAGEFNASMLYFLAACFGTATYRRHELTVDMASLPLGTAVMHSGLKRHAFDGVGAGTRMNMVVWLGSSQYERPAFVSPGPWEGALEPDPACLAEDDADYCGHCLGHCGRGGRCRGQK
ncbi:unnamed protein product, partial [Prorocentrum cordatum]